MGESKADVVSMAMQLRELRAESIPVNFLNAIDGTPLQKTSDLTPQDCLRTLAMFRMVNPTSELRISGGRELHLRTLQPLGLYPANSVIVGDYLTTSGQPPEEDYKMIRDLGFEVTGSVGLPDDPSQSALPVEVRSCGGGGCGQNSCGN
jgi:biotin synthase